MTADETRATVEEAAIRVACNTRGLLCDCDYPICLSRGCGEASGEKHIARAVLSVVAPLILEQAARDCERTIGDSDDYASAVRALKAALRLNPSLREQLCKSLTQ